MSFEEPKAPIVRIRKKKTKKKSKDNDIVHLPVRASQQGRYSSLTTPPNPQTKGRECCRHMFASCMKIPVCRLICFRCILPKCYSGEGSDDEDANIKDEGYHSQNRRSSEILPNPEGGAQGGTDPQSVEMTEIKSETVTLIPPPRTTVNEYRRDPCKSEQSNGKTDGEVTYIEVESVSFTDSNAALIIPDGDSKSDDTKEFKLETLETGYEEPVQAGVLEFPILKLSTKEDSSEYVECDNSDDSESRIYVNESVLGIYTDSNEKKCPSDLNYINVGPTGSEKNEMHSKGKVELGKPHEYVNLPSFESTAITVNDDVNTFESSTPTSERETRQEHLLQDCKKETETVLTDLVVKLPSNKSADANIDTNNDSEVKDNSDSENNFVIESSDAEKLLDKKKENTEDIATDALDNMEDNSENEHDGDQTKLL